MSGSGGLPNTRIIALDGLRGIAALVVLVHHSFLTSPSLALPYEYPGIQVTSWERVLIYTPLHVIWDGTGAVYVFFVLSGFVLALPFLDRPRFWDWAAYYPRRILRLYVPVWAAVVLAVGLAVLVPRRPGSGASWWMLAHPESPSPSGVMHDLVLVAGTDWTNSALWSLRWEVIFSMVLPLVVLGVLVFSRLWLIKVVSLLCLVGAAQHFAMSTALLYLPIFALGVLLAQRRRSIQTFMARRGFAQFVVATGGLLLLEAVWWGRSVDAEYVGVAAPVATVAGACLLVVAFMAWPPAVRVGESRHVRWLGEHSFSFYLVHEPIVVSIAVLVGARAWLVLLLSLPLALLTAFAFTRLVERPALRLARRVGQSVQRLAAGQLSTPTGVPAPERVVRAVDVADA